MTREKELASLKAHLAEMSSGVSRQLEQNIVAEASRRRGCCQD
jgi:hypothetical protein